MENGHTKNQLTRSYRPGEVIFTEGEQGDCAFLIDEGRVEICLEDDAKTPVAILGVGEIFGEMSIIDGTKRSATARALSHCKLSVVSKTQLIERLDEADPVVRLLISMLMDRIRRSNKRVGARPTLVQKIQAAKKVHVNEIDFTKDVIEKIRFEKELHQALAKEEFSLHFQPIFDFKSGLLGGFEALARWDSPEHGMVRPDIFMGIAEETSLIVPLGQWIIKKACYDFAQAIKSFTDAEAYKSDIFISINVSGRQMSDPKFFEVLQKSVWSNGLKPKQIKLEITERVLVGGTYVFEWIRRCRDMGFSIALDDFGTGYSSMAYLNQLEVNNIKIDKSFVQDMNENPNTKVIVRNLIKMAKGLQKQVIAEGVETEAQYQTLKKMGATYAQGYLLSRPLPTEKIEDFLRDEFEKGKQFEGVAEVERKKKAA